VISKPLPERNREAVEQAAHAFNEQIMMLSTVLLTLFTGALWLVNIWLIRDARRVSNRQADDTRRAIEFDQLHCRASLCRSSRVLVAVLPVALPEAFLDRQQPGYLSPKSLFLLVGRVGIEPTTN